MSDYRNLAITATKDDVEYQLEIEYDADTFDPRPRDTNDPRVIDPQGQVPDWCLMRISTFLGNALRDGRPPTYICNCLGFDSPPIFTDEEIDTMVWEELTQ